MRKQSTKEKARTLRRDGKSISEIAAALHTSASTVSYWCRDIRLTKQQQLFLAARQERAGAIGRLAAAERKREARIRRTAESVKEGIRDVGALKPRDVFMLGLALYWGEGYKRGNEECGLTNSDPHIINAYILWLQHVFNVGSDTLILRVSLNGVHAHRVREVEKYWSSATGIPLTQFTTPSLIKTASKKVYGNEETHFGTLRVKVRQGTALRRRILGAIGEVKDQLKKLE